MATLAFALLAVGTIECPDWRRPRASKGMRMRGEAITVLFSVCTNRVLPSLSR